MSNYEIGFTYKVEEYGVVSLTADNDDQADEFAREHVREAYPDVTDIQIDFIKEVK